LRAIVDLDPLALGHDQRHTLRLQALRTLRLELRMQPTVPRARMPAEQRWLQNFGGAVTSIAVADGSKPYCAPRQAPHQFH
jgi:hypothetical protein